LGFLAGVTGIAAGGGLGNLHSLAVQADGTVLAWGSNANGQVGTGNNTSSTVPVEVTGLGSGSGVSAVSAAIALSFALKSDGSVLAWGDSSSGELGDGSFSAERRRHR
jgi:alpha-tubulin suppressor-like RCC1 family protein